MGLTVSVVIRTYNGERFILDALESVFAQTEPPEEIVVVDSASTDATAAIVEEIAHDTPVPIHPISLPENEGDPAWPLNVGIDAARGEVICLLDQDDVMLPKKLAVQSAVLEEHEEVDFVLSDHENFDAEGIIHRAGSRSRYPEELAALMKGPGPVHIIDPVNSIMAFVSTPTMAHSGRNFLFRKSVWKRIGGFDHKSGTSCDVDFLLRGIDKPVAWIDAVLYRKRIHKDRFWHYTAKNRIVSLKVRQRTVRRFPDHKGLRIMVAQMTCIAAQELRWNRHYLLSLRAGLQLIPLRYPKEAFSECTKTMLAIVRSILP